MIPFFLLNRIGSTEYGMKISNCNAMVSYMYMGWLSFSWAVVRLVVGVVSIE